MPAEIADGVEITVAIGFSTGAGNNTVPLGSTLSSITYTDVSTAVRSVQIKRGRSSELDDFTTGNCQVILSNEDRTFDPENTVGAYYGELTPGRPIRIQATAPGGSAQTIFQGYVDQWDQQYTNPSDAVAVVTASDAFKVLNLINLPSFWDYQIDIDAPTQWFKFDDGTRPSTAFDSASNSVGGTWQEFYGYTPPGGSADSLIQNSVTPAAVFSGLNWINCAKAQPSVRLPATANKITVEFWIQTSHATAGDYAIMGGGRDFGVGMTVNGSGVGVIRGFFNDPVIGIYPTMTTTTTQVNDGLPHHVVMVFDYTTSRGIYVDGTYFGGAYETYPTFSSTFEGTPNTYKIGWIFSPFTTAADNFTSGLKATLDELCIYDGTALSAAQVANHYAIGIGTYGAGQRTDQRLESILAMANWMTDGETFSTATSTVQGIDTQNKTVLSALKECETADQGRLFCDRSGLVKFISHSEMAVNSTYNTSQRTFGDGTGELPYLDLEFTYNDQLIYNRTIIGRREGATAVINDTTSQGQYFIRTDSLSGLINDTDDATTDIARVRSATYKQPQLRIEQMRFSPRRLTSMYAATITDDIGTRITVNRRPQGVGSVISKELIIEGITHDIGISSWVTTYNLSPAPLPFLVLDNTTYGVLDSVNVLGF